MSKSLYGHRSNQSLYILHDSGLDARNLTLLYAYNKNADTSVHRRSLISSFVNYFLVRSMKIRKTVKIRKRYNQVPHLTQDTTWESNKNTINITNKSQEVSLLPADDHKAATNRQESIKNTRHKKHK